MKISPDERANKNNQGRQSYQTDDPIITPKEYETIVMNNPIRIIKESSIELNMSVPYGKLNY